VINTGLVREDSLRASPRTQETNQPFFTHLLNPSQFKRERQYGFREGQRRPFPLELNIPFLGFLFSLFSIFPGGIEDFREKSCRRGENGIYTLDTARRMPLTDSIKELPLPTAADPALSAKAGGCYA
jgi:hypothetical protein